MTLFGFWKYRPAAPLPPRTMFPESLLVFVRTVILIAISSVTALSVAGEETKTGSVDEAVSSRTVAARPWQYIVVHHSATTGGSVESIDRAHKQRVDSNGNPWRGIGYHFVIGNGADMADGQVAPTFRWNKQIEGAHAGSRVYNELGIGICLIGNFENEPPTSKQTATLRRLVDTLRQTYDVPADDIVAHGDIRATACPGRLFPREEFLTAGLHRTTRHHTTRRPVVGARRFEPSCDDAQRRPLLRIADGASEEGKESR